MLGRGSTANACLKASEAWDEWGAQRDTQGPDYVRFTLYSRVSGKPE